MSQQKSLTWGLALLSAFMVAGGAWSQELSPTGGVYLDIVIANCKSDSEFDFRNAVEPYLSEPSKTDRPPSKIAAALSPDPPDWEVGVVKDEAGFMDFLHALPKGKIRVTASGRVWAQSARSCQYLASSESGTKTTLGFTPVLLEKNRIFLEVRPEFTFPGSRDSDAITSDSALLSNRPEQQCSVAFGMRYGQTMCITFHKVDGGAPNSVASGADMIAFVTPLRDKVPARVAKKQSP